MHQPRADRGTDHGGDDDPEEAVDDSDRDGRLVGLLLVLGYSRLEAEQLLHEDLLVGLHRYELLLDSGHLNDGLGEFVDLRLDSVESLRVFC